MKTPKGVNSIAPLTDAAVKPEPDGLRNTPLMMLTVVEDKELLHLPPIHQTTTRPLSRPVRRTSSARVQNLTHPDHELRFDKTKGRVRSLVDIHEESVDSDVSSSKTPETGQNDTPCDSSLGVKLLVNREDQQRGKCTSSSRVDRPRGTCATLCVIPGRPRIRNVDPHISLPNKHPSFLKAYGGEREYPEEDTDSDLPSAFHGKDYSLGLQNRSMSMTSFLPGIPPPAGINRCKSTSQPDIFQRSCRLTPQPPSELNGGQDQRVQKLWQWSVRVLRSSKDRAEDDVSWVTVPGAGFLRPVYNRWPLRRHALAEPERMCMPQHARERILKDVEIRKRSMKRRVSQFFTVKLNLPMEEDLAA